MTATVRKAGSRAQQFEQLNAAATPTANTTPSVRNHVTVQHQQQVPRPSQDLVYGRRGDMHQLETYWSLCLRGSREAHENY
jgi:hypothetical protein